MAARARDGTILVAAAEDGKAIKEYRLPLAILGPRGASKEDHRLLTYISPNPKLKAKPKPKPKPTKGRRKARRRAMVDKKKTVQNRSPLRPSSNAPIGGPASTFAGRPRVHRHTGRH